MGLLLEGKYSAAKTWIYSSLFWLSIGPFLGFFMSLQFLFPRFMEFLDPLHLSFGKLRAIHTNAVIYAWFGMAAFGLTLYIVPKLCNSDLYNEKVGVLSAWIFNLAIVLDVLALWSDSTSFIFGRQPFEYAEAPLFVDLIVVVAVVLLIYNLTYTVFNRKVVKLYISVWYLLGGMYMTAIVYLVGNIAILPLKGINMMLINSWWIHNAVGLFITPFGVGIAYFVLPKSARKPLYSHRLSLIGFWTLIAIYPITGAHHYLQAPMPTWLNTLTVVSSILLLVPVFAVITNLLATPRGGGYSRLEDSYPLRFMVVGTIYYLLTCLQGPFHASNVVNWFIHFTEWVPAHAHLAALGAFSMYAIGGIYYVIPRITGKKIWSRRLADWNFWFLTIGIMAFWVAFTVSGIVQAVGINYMQQTVYDMIPKQTSFRIARTVFGGFIVLGMWIFIYNIYKTIREGLPFNEGDEVVP